MKYSLAKSIQRTLDDLKRRRPRRPIYRVWSLTTIVLLAIGVTALAAAIVYTFGHRSFLVETTRVLAVVSTCLFAFLTIGLYRGARVRKRDFPSTIPPFVAADYSPDIDPSLLDVSSFDADSLAGFILGAILWILVMVFLCIALPIVLWLLVNSAIAVGFFLFIALAWVFSRATRTVFVKSRTCRQNLMASIGYAAIYTFLYTGWLFALTRFAIYLSPAAAG